METRIWLLILALLSLFTGISINGEWSFVYQNTFFFFHSTDMMYKDIVNHQQLEWCFLIFWLITFLSQITLFLFPFIFDKIDIKKWIFYIPLIFVLSQMFFWSIFAFILIPLIIVWLCLLFYLRKKYRVY